MPGPFVHNIDPVLFSIGGVHFWWYGLSFALGFINAHLFLRRQRERLGLTIPEIYDLTLYIAIGILVGGRILVVSNNEWEFYHDHLALIPAVWNGGMASHGLIVGGAAGVVLFSYFYKVPFRPVLDALAVSAAIILGFGRIGNFIDGQIYGSLTDMPWGVKFPEVAGFRHPVVLYDGLKNFLLVPILIWLQTRKLPPGRIAVIFVILYAGLRIPIDLLREYPTYTLGLPNGQLLNIIMLLAGIAGLAVNLARHPEPDTKRPRQPNLDRLWIRKALLATLCLSVFLIPSDATRDVPRDYSARHPGLVHSWLYPDIGDALAAAQAERDRKLLQK